MHRVDQQAIFALQRMAGNKAVVSILKVNPAPRTSQAQVQRASYRFANPQAPVPHINMAAEEIWFAGTAAGLQGTVDVMVYPPAVGGIRAVGVPKQLNAVVVHQLVNLADPVVEPELGSTGLSKKEGTQKGREEFSYGPATNRLWGATGGPSADDVTQGELGNCGIISALEVVALKWPQLITTCLSATPQGITYSLQHIVKPPGKWDYAKAPPRSQGTLTGTMSLNLPIVRTQNTLLYAGRYEDPTTTQLGLWPAYLEKALAIMWGGYDSLIGAPDNWIYAALGAKYTGLGSSRTMINGKPPADVERLITAADNQGRGLVSTSISGYHNFSIVGVTATHVILRDPTTDVTSQTYKRSLTSPFALDTDNPPHGYQHILPEADFLHSWPGRLQLSWQKASEKLGHLGRGASNT